MGRRKLYDQAIAEKILDRIANGETLTKICEDADMPCRKLASNWGRGRSGAPESYVRDYAQARIAQAEKFFDQVIEMSDATGVDPTHEKTNSARLSVDSRKWVLARMDSKTYGERTALDLGGQSGAPPIVHADLSVLSADERKSLGELARKLITTKGDAS